MDKHLPYRHSIRLRGFDYASNGACAVTICSRNRECLFGEVVDGEMVMSDLGKLASQCRQEIPSHFPSVFLDVFVVMPNHLHGILLIDSWRTGTACRAPTTEAYQRPVQGSMSTVIRSFKSAVTKHAREQSGDSFKRVFQRGFHENVITFRHEHLAIRNYILNNPARWAEDEENPSRQTSR